MTKLQLAVEYMYSLYNHSDHLAKLVEEARCALAVGDLNEAARWLDEASSRPAPMIDMCLSDAKRSLEAARDEADRPLPETER